MILVLTDDVAAKSAQVGWRGAALKAANVEIMAVPIPEEIAGRMRVAQGRQRMVNDGGERRAREGERT
ncbi:MAG TPA: hypothetical protein VH137_10520 [Gemmatimonadales bacterium]|nr:hypothetical protein [Gemmatimonadales bacterium]